MFNKKRPCKREGQNQVLDYRKSTTTGVGPIAELAFSPYPANTQGAWEGSGHSLQAITVQFSPGSWFQYDEVIICQVQEQELELHKKT